MKRITEEELRSALQQAGLNRGEVVMMHSGIWSLGQLADTPLPRMLDRFLDLILDFLGPEGTLVVPTFSYGVCKSLDYDRESTPSQDMGALSEALRIRSDAERSWHPLQSVAAVGRAASDICTRGTKGAFNLGGPFDRMIGLEARLLLLGTTMQAASLIHYVEERCVVPYRYWKTFKVRCHEEGIVTEKDADMFVRDLRADPKLDLAIVSDCLKQNGELRVAALGAGQVLSCRFRDFVKRSMELLQKNRLCLLSNKEKVAAVIQEQERNRQ
jgi:aminoglycoside N3'-acetyltransferase